MKTTTKTSVVITYQELVDMVKRKLPYNVQDNDIEVIVEHFIKEDVIDELDVEWVDVPKDWDKEYCPNPNARYVEVMFQNGTYKTGEPGYWDLAWIQNDHYNDIIKYRELK